MTEPTPSGRSENATRWFALGMVLLTLLGAFLPGIHFWGFNSLSFLDRSHVTVYLFLLAGWALFVLRGWFEPAVRFFSDVMEHRPGPFLAAVLLLFLITTIAFRVESPLLGDSWFLIGNLAGVARGADIPVLRDEPLATLWFTAVATFRRATTYQAILDSFFAADLIAGIAFVVALVFAVKAALRDPGVRLLSFVLAMSLPSTLLFFGYVETYSVVLLAITLYCLAGFQFLRGRVPLAVTALMFLLMAMTHYLTVLMLPSLILLAHRAYRQGRRREVLIAGAVLATALLALFVAVGGGMSGLYSAMPHRHYLPLVADEEPAESYSTPYTLISWKHAVDLVNVQLLLFPAAIFLFLAAKRRTKREEGPQAGGVTAFLLAGQVPVILFLLVAKFDPGIARDWDLLAPYAVPAVLLGVSSFDARRPPGETRRHLLLLVGLTLANSFLFYSVNAAERRSVERFETLLDPSLVSQGAVYSGLLYLSSYYRVNADLSAPMVLWEKYVREYPGDARGYVNVLRLAEESGSSGFGDRIRAWGGGSALSPEVRNAIALFLVDAGNEHRRGHDSAAARERFTAAVIARPADPAVLSQLAQGFLAVDDTLRARETFAAADSAYRLLPAPPPR